MTTIFINGKFIGQATTGAQRFAMQTVLALDSHLYELHDSNLLDFALVIPRAEKVNLPDLKKIRIIELPGRSSHLWEQVTLPFFLKNSFLINLSGSAPIFKRNQIFTIFDAAIFDFPQAYSKKFLIWYQTQFRMQSRFCSGLLTISKFSAGRLCYHLGLDRSKFKVVSCGADHIFKNNSDERVLNNFNLKKNSYLLAVGSANPSKNFAALIKAFSNLEENQSINLVVVGGVNSAVFADSVTLNDKRIIKVGRVDDAQLKALYSNAIAFVFPSLYEGFGIPPLEAMACGCPVIASYVSSIPEVCENAVGYFDPTSICSMQNILKRVVLDDEWRVSLQEAGAKLVLKYTWHNTALMLLQNIKENICSRLD